MSGRFDPNEDARVRDLADMALDSLDRPVRARNRGKWQKTGLEDGPGGPISTH